MTDEQFPDLDELIFDNFELAAHANVEADRLCTFVWARAGRIRPSDQEGTFVGSPPMEFGVVDGQIRALIDWGHLGLSEYALRTGYGEGT
jgi:hypothetical protein